MRIHPALEYAVVGKDIYATSLSVSVLSRRHNMISSIKKDYITMGKF